ncbi:MAG: hypothetical protein ACTSXH_19235, partial [Promethearchaeota archaeon]
KKQKLYLLYRYLNENIDKMEERYIKKVGDRVQALRDKIIEEQNRSKIEDFESFTSEKIIDLKNDLREFRKKLNDHEVLQNLELKQVNKEIEKIQDKFEAYNKKYLLKLENCRKAILNFEDKLKVTLIQWDKFSMFFKNELSMLKEEMIDTLLLLKINQLSNKHNSDSINLKEFEEETNLSCKFLIEKIKNLIESSKVEGQLYEDKKCLLLFTDHYYKNRELRYFIDNKLIKESQEKMGKILALFDSAVKKMTLSVNLLEIQNRINDLENFEVPLIKQFEQKVRFLEIDLNSRTEYLKTREHFFSLVHRIKHALNQIKTNLTIFKEAQTLIITRFEALKLHLQKIYSKLMKESDNARSYLRVKKGFEEFKMNYERSLTEVDKTIEENISQMLNQTEEAKKFTPELQALRVKAKKQLIEEYKNKKNKLEKMLESLKNKLFQGNLLTLINDSKIHLSQLLGTLQKKVEDTIEIKEFKRAQAIVQKRVKNINMEIKNIQREIRTLIKTYNKQAIGFESQSKYILDDFEHFLNEYGAALLEKEKTLERTILKEYVSMTINAVTNQYLTIGFLNHELGIKKQNIQDHLLFLISSGQLKGKYDPRMGLYYEDPQVLKDLDENELEVIKTMNFKVYMFLNRLKNFTSQYYSIIAFFASFLTISYYLFTLSGGSPLALIIPAMVLIVLLSFMLLKKRREEKIKI